MPRRLRNLWAWSSMDPNALRTVSTTPEAMAKALTATAEAKIISAADPEDELIDAIRKEDTREA